MTRRTFTAPKSSSVLWNGLPLASSLALPSMGCAHIWSL